MKKINEMSEQEILALTMDDVTMLAKQALMEENVKLVREPDDPEVKKIPKGDILYYHINMPNDIVFTDINEAVAVADILRKCLSVHDRSCNWTLDGRYYNITPVTGNDRFSNTYEVEADWGYSDDAYSSIKSALESNSKETERYKKELEVFYEFNNRVNRKKSEILPIVYQTIDKYNRLNSMCEDYLNCYLPTAGNDPETAMKFMTLAYGLTEEEKKYIIENTTKGC